MKQIRPYHKSMHIVLHTDGMFCYVIEPTSDNTFKLHTKEYPLAQKITPALIYNPTHLRSILNSFITDHHLKKSHLYVILTDPLIQEQVCLHHKHHASLQELVQLDHQKTYHHNYIGPLDERALFYVSSITQTLLLQLQLLCSQLPCYLQAIQACLPIQYDLYAYIHHNKTPRAQVATKINPHTLLIEDLLTSPLLARLVKNQDITQDKNIIYALGSFIGAHI